RSRRAHRAGRSRRGNTPRLGHAACLSEPALYDALAGVAGHAVRRVSEVSADRLYGCERFLRAWAVLRWMVNWNFSRNSEGISGWRTSIAAPVGCSARLCEKSWFANGATERICTVG